MITGGSQGLGLAIANELLQRGDFEVTLIARRMDALIEAKQGLEVKGGNSAQVWLLAADVTDQEGIAKAIAEAHDRRPISWVFCCAGAAKPGLFLEQDLKDHQHGWQLNYQGTVNTLQPALRLMIRDRVIDPRVILIGSTLSCMGLVGYTQYCPTKMAIKGLAECLRQELLPHAVGVHCYLVGTIDTPGYKQETDSKPTITRLIEGAESGDISAQGRAKTLLAGLQANHFLITSDWLNDLFRVSVQGTSPRNSLLDFLLLIVSWIALPLFRRHADGLVLAEKREKKVSKDE